jgi:D-aminoacyl-tRNA deacylase
MTIVLQRVSQASVEVAGEIISSIEKGYVLLLCVEISDTSDDVAYLTQKIVNIRLFEGDEGKINDRSILDIDGDILVVSQFTLAGHVTKGSRPDYTAAADRETAEALYYSSIDSLSLQGVRNVCGGVFGANMQLHLVNDGPVTLILRHP